MAKTLIPRASCGTAVLTAVLLTACGGGGEGETVAAVGTGTPATSGSSSAPASTGTASLSWSAPTQNDDGSTLTDLAGFRVYSGTDPSALRLATTISDPRATSTQIANLVAGTTHYFAVSAFTLGGLEGARSDIGSKRVP